MSDKVVNQKVLFRVLNQVSFSDIAIMDNWKWG